MTNSTESPEPTLTDVINHLDKLSEEQERFSEKLGRFSQELGHFSQNQERFNDRFGNYQQATQWVVQLAFTLIASATLTVIITAVFKR